MLPFTNIIPQKKLNPAEKIEFQQDLIKFSDFICLYA